jgi:hypothetical protein
MYWEKTGEYVSAKKFPNMVKETILKASLYIKLMHKNIEKDGTFQTAIR